MLTAVEWNTIPRETCKSIVQVVLRAVATATKKTTNAWATPRAAHMPGSRCLNNTASAYMKRSKANMPASPITSGFIAHRRLSGVRRYSCSVNASPRTEMPSSTRNTPIAPCSPVARCHGRSSGKITAAVNSAAVPIRRHGRDFNSLGVARLSGHSPSNSNKNASHVPMRRTSKTRASHQNSDIENASATQTKLAHRALPMAAPSTT